MSTCLIGLGSNQGNRQETLDDAVDALRRHPHITVLATSAWIETTPVGGPANQSPFLNGAATIETNLDPRALLACLQQIENQFGRERAERWGPRTIDLDLLLYDRLTLDTPSLVLPHPRMAWRRFVLEPAAQIAGSMLHPTTQWTIARLFEHLSTTPRYVAITGPIAAGKTRLAQQLASTLSAQLILEQPNWQHLDAFYADPPEHAWLVELEFLRQRTRLLDIGNTMPSGWLVSDFWFDQSAAFARAWLPEQQLPAYLEQFQPLQSKVVRPRLVVLLDAPAEELLAGVRHRGRTCEQHLTQTQLDSIRHAIVEQVHRPDSGPVLYLNNNDRETVLAEVLAAVQGMQ